LVVKQKNIKILLRINVLVVLEGKRMQNHEYITITISVVMVVGICNSVGGGVYLTCHRGAAGEYRSV